MLTFLTTIFVNGKDQKLSLNQTRERECHLIYVSFQQSQQTNFQFDKKDSCGLAWES